MRGEAVPQRMNADTLGDAGTPGCQANDPMQLARTRMLPAVAGKQPGLTGRHPALLARDAPPFVQYLENDGRENDVSILLAPRLREGRLLPCSTRMSIRSRSISVSLSDTTSEARRPVAYAKLRIALCLVFVAAASSRPTSSGLRTTGRRRGSRVEMSSSARSWRFSVILKKNRSAVALTLAVPTDVSIEASHN